MEMNISVPTDLRIHTLANKEAIPYAPFPFTSYQVCPYKIASTLCSQLLMLQEGESPDNILLDLEEVDLVEEAKVADLLNH